MEAGWHLWAVTLNNAANTTLWVTTVNRDCHMALSKAETVIRTQGYGDSQVQSLKYHGTLDA